MWFQRRSRVFEEHFRGLSDVSGCFRRSHGRLAGVLCGFRCVQKGLRVILEVFQGVSVLFHKVSEGTRTSQVRFKGGLRDFMGQAWRSPGHFGTN